MIKSDNLKNHAIQWRDFLLDILFPLNCVSCKREGSWLCSECFNDLSVNSEHYCLNCKLPSSTGKFCLNCRTKYSLDGVLIAGNYKNAILSDLIKIYKYHFAKDISKILGLFAYTFIEKNFSVNKTYKPDILKNITDAIIIPAPLHKKRLRWRGFNQSELLAKIIAQNLHSEINYTSLQRIKNTLPQTKFDENERKVNILDAFVWRGNNLKNKNILLIDDVVTTGSTLNECAKVLKQNGANEVWGLVIANG